MIIECSSVSKRFGDRLAVDQLELEIPAGLCFGLLGPNGAGKTTTLKMIYGVTSPSAGTVHVFGTDVTKNPRAVRARLGVALQENALIEVISPLENLRIFGRYHLLAADVIESRAQEVLDFLELRSHADVPVQALSGGFKRRLAIAISLMNAPELLILDEPTTGLDPAVRQALWERIRALRAAGTTILLTTHYMDEAERLCDRLAILTDGRVVVEGAPRDLIRQVLSPEVLEVDVSADLEKTVLGELNGIERLRHGNRLNLYVEDAGALLETMRHRKNGASKIHTAATIRPTNLEDVFLKLTGTNLEAQENGGTPSSP